MAKRHYFADNKIETWLLTLRAVECAPISLFIKSKLSCSNLLINLFLHIKIFNMLLKRFNIQHNDMSLDYYISKSKFCPMHPPTKHVNLVSYHKQCITDLLYLHIRHIYGFNTESWIQVQVKSSQSDYLRRFMAK